MLDVEINQEYAWIHSHFLPQHNDLLANPITDISTRSIRGKKSGWNRYIRLAMRIMKLQIMIGE